MESPGKISVQTVNWLTPGDQTTRPSWTYKDEGGRRGGGGGVTMTAVE